MNLEELRASLESDAYKRSKEQEKTIRRLHEKLSEQRSRIKIMENRCFAQTAGSLCFYCGFKEDCSARSEKR